MSELNSKYNELINEIFRNFIFYIPISILDMEEFKKLPEESKSVIDRITYIDEDLNFVYENSLGFSTLLLKSSKLKNNCFKLIEYKETLNAISFSYLSENYLKQLETYAFFSNQLSLYFEKNSPDKDINTQALFNCQSLNFNTHIAEVEKITGLKVQNFNQQNFIQEVKETPVFKRFSVNLAPREKYFRDFISHEKNKEIESTILKKYPTIKGKKMRYIIDFLVKKKALTITYGTQTELYDALKRTFNCNIGTYPSIFGYKVNENKDSDYSRITNELETILNQYF
ncbi:hypothetical protein [Flavobacterium terrae]|uniref:Uncharacterized protein n=1 Tax=Flavobacterium terrae TaxID=415425 RepID=A0A1M6DDT9_9FLAO|nr:hypothetical protein [Flavobacterium terrae]SHI71325.1 hypothetical protein SAMN05444363_1384 [Flavobacterium terrae]